MAWTEGEWTEGEWTVTSPKLWTVGACIEANVQSKETEMLRRLQGSMVTQSLALMLGLLLFFTTHRAKVLIALHNEVRPLFFRFGGSS